MLHANCLLCNSTKINKLANYSTANLVVCEDCGFVFSQNKPSDIELLEYYKKYPITLACRSVITVKRYYELLDILETFRRHNNIIDIGCGEGHFLEVAKKRNWNVYGIEFSDVKVSICKEKGIKVLQGRLNPDSYEKDFFDVIISSEVIEHINYPVQEIINFQTILRKGGAVYLTTPNFGSLSRLILKERWRIIEYPEHLCYFTPKTMSFLLEKAGLKPIFIRTTGLSITKLRASIGMRNKRLLENNVVSDDEKLRELSENKKIFMIAKNTINLLLKSINKGDTIKVLAIKV